MNRNRVTFSDVDMFDDETEDSFGFDCDECGGEGLVHDCGEDTCCCADPDDDLVPCPACGGTGR